MLQVLRLRFQPLLEETALRAISELHAFARRSGETTDSLLSRFQSVMTRAHTQGNLVIPPQGLSWILLRAVGVSHTQLMQILAPLNGILPSTMDQMIAMCHYILMNSQHMNVEK